MKQKILFFWGGDVDQIAQKPGTVVQQNGMTVREVMMVSI